MSLFHPVLAGERTGQQVWKRDRASRRWRGDLTQHTGDRRGPVGSVSCQARRPSRARQACFLAAVRAPPGTQHPLAQARLLQLTLVHLRKDETFSHLGADFGISQATAWRYVVETLDVLASWAPGLHEALTALGEGDHAIVDGALIPPTESARTNRTTCKGIASTA